MHLYDNSDGQNFMLDTKFCHLLSITNNGKNQHSLKPPHFVIEEKY